MKYLDKRIALLIASISTTEDPAIVRQLQAELDGLLAIKYYKDPENAHRQNKRARI